MIEKANREASHQYLEPTKKVYSRDDQWLKIRLEESDPDSERDERVVAPRKAAQRDVPSGVLRQQKVEASPSDPLGVYEKKSQGRKPRKSEKKQEQSGKGKAKQEANSKAIKEEDNSPLCSEDLTKVQGVGNEAKQEGSNSSLCADDLEVSEEEEPPEPPEAPQRELVPDSKHVFVSEQKLQGVARFKAQETLAQTRTMQSPDMNLQLVASPELNWRRKPMAAAN